MEKLSFLGRENYVDYLWAKCVTGCAYFQRSGILLYENSVLSLYATQQEINGARKSTDHLLQDSEGIYELEKQFKFTKKRVEKLSHLFSRKSLRDASNEELYKRFTQLIDTLVDYVSLYRLTEPHCVEYIETLVLDIIKSKTGQNAYEVLAKFLSSKNIKDIECTFSKEERQLFDVLDTIAKVRFEAKKIVNPLGRFSDKILEESATRNDLAVNQISNLDLKELRNLLTKNRTPSLEIVNKRQHSFALRVSVINSKVTITDLSDQKTKELIAYDRGRSNVSILKGDIGYPGCISGTARVAPLLSEPEEYSQYISSLQQTDILIASMTGPDLTPAFSKVAAVVTDEGGLMSHAALVAREKKVPCVIGTRTATRTFKTGEKVFVDATSGIVYKK